MKIKESNTRIKKRDISDTPRTRYRHHGVKLGRRYNVFSENIVNPSMDHPLRSNLTLFFYFVVKLAFLVIQQ